jgi:hypothetical protein
VAEHDLLAELKQAIRFRGSYRLSWDAQDRGRSPKQNRLTGRLGRSHQQQPLGRGGQPLDAPPETRFDPARQRLLARQAEAASQSRRGQFAGQLKQRQRIPARLGEYPIAHALV